MEVRREDQEKINKFSSLHQKETTLEEELRAKIVSAAPSLRSGLSVVPRPSHCRLEVFDQLQNTHGRNLELCLGEWAVLTFSRRRRKTLKRSPQNSSLWMRRRKCRKFGPHYTTQVTVLALTY